MKPLVFWIWFMTASIALLAGQQRVTIDQAILKAQKLIEQELPPGTKIIVISFKAPDQRMSDYVVEKLTHGIINGKKLIVIEREELSLIQQELTYQYSGNVSDRELQTMGAQVGAQSIVYGKYDALLGFSIKAVNVETAIIEGSYQTELKGDAKLDALLEASGMENLAEDQRKEAARPAEEAREKPAAEPKSKAKPRNRKLILGVRAGADLMANPANPAFAPGFDQDSMHLGQSFSFYIGTHNLDRMFGLQLEGNLVLNNGAAFTRASESLEVSYRSMDIPLLARFGFPELNLFLGPYISIPISPLTETRNGLSSDYTLDTLGNIMSSYGILGGLSIGIKVGPGYIVLDGRYIYDLQEIRITDAGFSVLRRHGFSASIGYSFWL
ncbi:MAG: hypothetical protein LBG90_06360 [Spirochaetaceae bacterium]|jgi:hypothetical protein|nr:hypothetical protein [Spirochaetaceae bacterium]